MKEHTARQRKCEETLAKLLKERKDTGSFAIEGKGKGEAWKREVKRKRGGGSTTRVNNTHLQNPVTPRKRQPQG